MQWIDHWTRKGVNQKYFKSVILDALNSFYWSSTSSYDGAWSNYIYESSLSSNDKNECALLCFVDGNCDFYVYQDGYYCLGNSNFIESPNLEPGFTPTSAEILFKRGKITIPCKQVSNRIEFKRSMFIIESFFFKFYVCFRS